MKDKSWHEDLRQSPPGFSPEFITPPEVRDGPQQIRSLALDLAGRCNMACRYCAEAATQPQRPAMSPSTLNSTWKFLLPDGKPVRGMTIRLGTGEPLLGFPLMKQLQELELKVKEEAENISGDADALPVPVFITTNGTLLDDEACDWLIRSGWNVKISLDGPKSIQDKWRVLPGGEGTFDKISGTVKRMAAEIPERFSVTAVLCQGSDPAEVFYGIAQLGVKRIELVPVNHRSDAVNPGPEDVKRYRAFVEDYADLYLEDRTEGLPHLVRFRTRVLRLMGYNLHRVPCGAGRSFLGVSPEGELYPCFRFVGVEEYRLGSLDSGLDADAVKTFQEDAGRPYNKRSVCNQCWAAPLCSGPCFAVAEMFGPQKGDPVPYCCDYVLADSKAAFRMVSQLREEDPEKLLPFFPNTLDLFEE